MTEEARVDAFRANAREAFAKFGTAEATLRAQYAKTSEDWGAAEGSTMLERETRRFLIDPVLKALGWDPDAPQQVAEEARSWTAAGKRLYFDYVGKTPSQLPVLLVEAKHCDCEWVRVPRGGFVSAREAARLISAELDALRRGEEGPLIATWSEWLSALRTYVGSLDKAGRASLQRVVLSAGSWMVVFEDPHGAFLGGADAAPPDEGAIHCFASRDEILAGARGIFRLIDRERLVDTLSLLLPEHEALSKISADTITRYWRGVVVNTSSSGVSIKRYPTRSVYPALVIETGGRIFGVAGIGAALEEPTDQQGLDAFTNELSRRGESFESDLLRSLGRTDLSARPLAELPAYRPDLGFPSGLPQALAVDGSTEAQADVPPRRGFVRSTGGEAHEFLAVTGEAWFYKLGGEDGCDFHSFMAARTAGKAAPEGRLGPTLTSFTETDQPRHCEHQSFREGLRGRRCEVSPIETHLCCRACIYEPECWATENDRRPCPPIVDQ